MVESAPPEAYRPKHCGEMARYLEDLLKRNCDSGAPDFQDRAKYQTDIEDDAFARMIVQRRRTEGGWGQISSKIYTIQLVGLPLGRSSHLILTFDSQTPPEELDPIVLDVVARHLPDLPVPVE